MSFYGRRPPWSSLCLQEYNIPTGEKGCLTFVFCGVSNSQSLSQGFRGLCSIEEGMRAPEQAKESSLGRMWSHQESSFCPIPRRVLEHELTRQTSFLARRGFLNLPVTGCKLLWLGLQEEAQRKEAQSLQ